MSALDKARRLIGPDKHMAVSNPEWRRLVAALLRIIDGEACPDCKQITCAPGCPSRLP